MKNIKMTMNWMWSRMRTKLFNQNYNLQVVCSPDLGLESGQVRLWPGGRDKDDHLQLCIIKSLVLRKECRVEGWRGQRLLLLTFVHPKASGQPVDMNIQSKL